MAITKIGGRQIDVDKSPLSSSNRDDSVLKDADGGLILTGNVRLLHAPSDDLDAATKAYVDASTGASVAAGFIAFGDSDGSGLEGSGDLMFYESGRAFGGSSTPVLALSGAVALGGSAGAPGLLLNYGGTVASGSVSVAGTLVLSSSRGEISFKDQGVEFFGIEETNSGDVVLSSSVSDKDMIFKVNDGGTATEVFRLDGDVSAMLVATNKEIQFGDSGEAISGDDTDLTIKSGAKINLTATSDVHLPNDVGVVFGNAGEKIEGDGTNLTIATAILKLSASSDVALPQDIGLTFANDEKIESDGTNLTINGGTTLKLSASGDVALPSGIGLVLDGNGDEKIESNGTDLTVSSGGDIDLTATGDVNIPANVGLTFGNDGEKIEGNGTKLDIAASEIDFTVEAGGDINIGQDIGLTFGNDSQKIEADGSNHLTVTAGGNLVGEAGGQVTLDGAGGGVALKAGSNTVLSVTADTATISAGDTLAIPASAFFDAAAASQVSIAGVFAAGSATGYTIPNYVHNSFEYLSATQYGLGAPFARVDGSANLNVRHVNDATSFAAGASTRFVISGSTVNSSFLTSSVQAYLNGVRLTPCTSSNTHTADFAVTASSGDGVPMLHVNLDPSLNLQSGDKVILDFRMQTNG